MRWIAIVLLLFCVSIAKSQPVIHHTAGDATGMRTAGKNGDPAKPIVRERFRRHHR
ncbi:MAG: hypothetical protein P4L51_08395 [Puia sp.]|nr:hypothetical protein [Puia sp.]